VLASYPAQVAVAVQTEVFDGPFDLLLHLILREQVDLYEVSLSSIVDAYLAELDRMVDRDLNVMTEFLLIAATLVELKARRLLPGQVGVELDDELALWEERDLLLSRLLEAKTFKDASAVLQNLEMQASLSVPRLAGMEEPFLNLMPDLLTGVSANQLRAAYLRAIEPKPIPRVQLDHVSPIRLSVADAVVELLDELPRVGTISFRRLTIGLVERLEVVVRFLAVLELYKQGLIDLQQPGTFGEISVTWAPLDDTANANLAQLDSYEG